MNLGPLCRLNTKNKQKYNDKWDEYIDTKQTVGSSHKTQDISCYSRYNCMESIVNFIQPTTYIDQRKTIRQSHQLGLIVPPSSKTT